MAVASYTADEIAARGREIYERRLRGRLEPQNVGKYVVIDVETGEYEMDASGYTLFVNAVDGGEVGIESRP